MKRPLGWSITLMAQCVLVPAAIASGTSTQQFNETRERLNQAKSKVDDLMRRNYARAGIPFRSATAESPFAAPEGQGEAAKLYRIHSALQTRRIVAGRLLFGRTIHRLIVGGDASPVTVELDDGQGSLSGLRMTGIAKASGTAGRVALEFSRIHLLSGNAITLSGAALDDDGAYGLQATVVSQKALAVAGAMASSFISGLASGSQTQTQNAFGISQVPPTGRNAILQGVSQTAAEQSKRLVDEATSEKPILIVEPFTELTVYVQDEVNF